MHFLHFTKKGIDLKISPKKFFSENTSYFIFQLAKKILIIKALFYQRGRPNRTHMANPFPFHSQPIQFVNHNFQSFPFFSPSLSIQSAPRQAYIQANIVLLSALHIPALLE